MSARQVVLSEEIAATAKIIAVRLDVHAVVEILPGTPQLTDEKILYWEGENNIGLSWDRLLL
jgi:hypothetical protein